jgi:hypothetical protein
MFGLPNRTWGNPELHRCPFCRDLVRGDQYCPCDLDTIIEAEAAQAAQGA